MSNIRRVIRIDLSVYDDRWSECYIDVSTRPFSENAEFEREFRQIVRRLEQLERKQTKLSNKMVGASQSEFEVLEQEEDEVIKEVDKITSGMLKKMQSFVKSSFVSGRILDGDNVRDMAVDDILQFDEEVISDISEITRGKIQKKVR